MSELCGPLSTELTGNIGKPRNYVQPNAMSPLCSHNDVVHAGCHMSHLSHDKHGFGYLRMVDNIVSIVGEMSFDRSLLICKATILYIAIGCVLALCHKPGSRWFEPR